VRKRLWQLHSWLGLICGLALLVIGVTGSVLVFHQEIDEWLHPAAMLVEPTPEGRLGPDVLLAGVNRALSDCEVTGWIFHPGALRRADGVYVIRHGTNEWLTVMVNPYTGALLSEPVGEGGTLTSWLLELHYTFLAGHVGVGITGVLGVGLCVLGLTGVWIYRKFWRAFFTLRWRESARIFFGDAHKLIGITSVAFNLVLGFTGAYWNITHVVGDLTTDEAQAEPLVTGRMYGDQLSLEAVLADAQQRLPGLEVTYLGLPWTPDADVTVYGTFADASFLRSAYGSYVTYNPNAGEHRGTVDIRTAGWWPQVLDAFYPLHYGDFGGLPIKLLWGLGGLAPGLLAITGSVIWWKRRRSSACGGP